MTVVEVYACGKKIDQPENKSLFSPRVLSFLIEGIAQNSTGSVFVPEVYYGRILRSVYVLTLECVYLCTVY